jgi:hypothetical protein
MAIQKNAVPLGTTQATYKQEVIAVSMQMTSVLTSNLPTLNQSPPDLQDFISTLRDAKSDASDWVNTVLFRLLGVPGQVRTYQDSVVASLTSALNETNTLIQNPADSSAAAGLQDDLNNLRCTLTTVRTVIEDTVMAIESFGDKLPRIAVDLDSIATRSAADAQADQQKIDELNDAIDDTKRAIRDLAIVLVALGVADGAIFTLGVVATIAAFPEGLAAWFFVGPLVAVLTVYVTLDAESLKSAVATLRFLEQEIQGITADAATLQVLSRNFGDLATGTTTVASSLNAVLQMWRNLETDVVDALADINAAIADKTSESFGRLRADLAQAMHEWNQLYALAGNLHLDLNVNTAGLQLGMSRSQVQAAAAKGKVVDIIQYYNTLGI